MGKTTNQKQFETLVSFMEKNPGLAKGFLPTKDAKIKATSLWENISVELNAAGPPIRNCEGWKKVWSDWKFHIKKKVQHNKKQLAGTGGGPNKVLSFTPIEESVMQLVGTRSAVEGVRGVSFGGQRHLNENLQTTFNRDDQATPSNANTNSEDFGRTNETTLLEQTTHTIRSTELSSEHTVGQSMQETEATSTLSSRPERHATVLPSGRSQMSSDSSSRIQLIQKQCDNQESFFSDVKETLKLIDGTNKEILKYTKKTYYLEEKKYELKKKKLKIIEKRNAEKLKVSIEVLKKIIRNRTEKT